MMRSSVRSRLAPPKNQQLPAVQFPGHPVLCRGLCHTPRFPPEAFPWRVHPRPCVSPQASRGCNAPASLPRRDPLCSSPWNHSPVTRQDGSEERFKLLVSHISKPSTRPRIAQRIMFQAFLRPVGLRHFAFNARTSVPVSPRPAWRRHRSRACPEEPCHLENLSINLRGEPRKEYAGRAEVASFCGYVPE